MRHLTPDVDRHRGPSDRRYHGWLLRWAVAGEGARRLDALSHPDAPVQGLQRCLGRRRRR